jgi:hypothetical protein
MINQERLNKLVPQIEEAVEEVFHTARNNEANPNDFVLFLVNAYKLKKADKNFSPYIIEDKKDIIFGKDRREFIEDFMELEYHYESLHNSSNDEKQKKKMRNITTHIELMIYSHAWESFPNLINLKHLANLVDSKRYDWELTIPETAKHEFIRKEIKGIFKTHNLKITDVMSESYHSQLRNAFAHSQYTFFDNFIRLGNYEGENWQIKNIRYEDWADRFLITALLFNIISKKKSEYKQKIGKEGREFTIWEPGKKGNFKRKVIVYNEDYTRFDWK